MSEGNEYLNAIIEVTIRLRDSDVPCHVAAGKLSQAYCYHLLELSNSPEIVVKMLEVLGNNIKSQLAMGVMH